jgi:[acyl-carrier-protein] S-malonyltransferase
MKLGILMSGQGAQQVGMGADLYANVPAYRAVVDRASAVLGYDLQTEVCEDEEKLAQTAYAQPAILAMSMGIYAALADVMPEPNAAVGLSLGEYSALTAAGVFDFEQAVAVIKDRGEYMQKAGDAHPGKMIAVMTDDQQLVVDCLAECQAQGHEVYPANFNTFNQIVVGGVPADVEFAEHVLQNEGVSRIVPLPVSGAFHTPLLADASEQLAARLAGEALQPMMFDVYSNTTGNVFTDVKATLIRQVVVPTHFAQDLKAMVDGGVDTVIEFGPSDTLTKFARKIVDKSVRRYSVTDLPSYQVVRKMLSDELAVTV